MIKNYHGNAIDKLFLVKNIASACILAIIFAVFFTGCSSRQSSTAPASAFNTRYDYGSKYIQSVNKQYNDTLVTAAEQKLKRHCIEIFSVGQDYKIRIPVNEIFYANSPRIRWESYALLNDAVTYLKYFNKIDLKIAAYTSPTGNLERDKALAVARARNVSDYFWGQAVDARVIYVKGYVFPNTNRIEMSFRSAM